MGALTARAATPAPKGAPNRLLAEATERHRLGRLGDAEALYRQVLVANPGNPDALHYLGAVLLQRDGDAGAAAELIGKAVRKRPRDVRMLCNLGTAYRRMDKIADAEDAFRKACAFGRDDADAHAKLGLTQYETGKSEDALKTLARAATLAPGRADVLVTVARIHADAAAYDAALDACNAALAADPACMDAHVMRLRVSLLLGRAAEAVDAGRRAVAISPTDPIAHAALGHALKSAGILDEAEAECRTSIRLLEEQAGAGRTDAPSLLAGAWFDLSQSTRFPSGSPDIAAMQDLRTRLDDAAPSTAILDFALAKALWDGGERAAAFDVCIRANALKRRTFAFDADAAAEDLRRRADGFAADAGVSRTGPEAPVFIVGMPRSGTTLAERILGQHPALGAAGELPYIRQIAERLGPDGTADLDTGRIEELRGEYLDRAQRHVGPGERPVDKALNFAHLGLIRILFPDAPVVHMSRDPVDTCVSCFRQLFASQVPFVYELRELGTYYRAYRDLMGRWQALWPNAIHIVRYEELVDGPEETVRDLLAFCGLGWDARCLDFRSGERAVLTASAAQVREGIYRTSVGAGRDRDLPISPLLDALGDCL
jgi:tetratricopeptide (TPR) repeat protein